MKNKTTTSEWKKRQEAQKEATAKPSIILIAILLIAYLAIIYKIVLITNQ